MIAATPPSRFLGTPADIRIRNGGEAWPGEELNARSIDQFGPRALESGMAQIARGIFGTKNWKPLYVEARRTAQAREIALDKGSHISETTAGAMHFRA